MADCISGRDELHCDSSLCPFRRAGAISVSVSGSEELVWDDVNLRGCARFCTEAPAGCVAFGYSAAGRRCRVFRSVSGLEDAPGWVLYVRQQPSELSSEMALETLSADGAGQVTSPRSANTGATASGSANTGVASSDNPEKRPTAASGRREFAQVVALSQSDGELRARHRATRAAACENDMFECRTLGPSECVPYSYVCNGKEECTYGLDEPLCDNVFATFARIQGYSIVSSMQLSGISKHGCAVYCDRHEYEFPKCDSFSYNQAQQLCTVGCASCADAPRIVRDTSADYYRLLPVIVRLGVRSRESFISSLGIGNEEPAQSQPDSSVSSGLNTPLGSPVTSFTTEPTASAATPVRPGASPSSLLPADCGRRPLDANPVFDTRTRVLSAGSSSRRVVGGKVVTYGTYPWQAQIQVYSNAGHFEHHCGGVLISERLVLTAAHCLRPALTRLQVKLGQHDRRDASEQFEQTFAVENALSHPGYGADPARGDADDIAVLKLRLRHGRPVVFSSHVQPLCLPRGPSPVGQECHISGWGKTDARLPDAASSAADILHGASVPRPLAPKSSCTNVVWCKRPPIVSDSVCAAPELYGSRFVAERMVCAGHLAGGADTCQGDSGGPLACPGADGRWQLSGIVSFGVGCGDLLKPGVYTRVSYYVPWIERVVQLL
ncbi:transmembrane protease serine 9-like [Amphibalanus amphitrite]|uniref:transmembrane protease serine 9-like n=1 Tax=Amphibalanus amphitrite TaxID=1232801 RepID=UPI001C923DEF|nr:transmembrane protease serine 9-like [Amphibalanus amphitrite]